MTANDIISIIFAVCLGIGLIPVLGPIIIALLMISVVLIALACLAIFTIPWMIIKWIGEFWKSFFNK